MWNSIETDILKGTAYFVGTKYKLDDYAPYILKRKIMVKHGSVYQWYNNTHFTRVIRADRKRPGLLFAGTNLACTSVMMTEQLKKFQLKLPGSLTDMTIKENDLIISTQGRSFWVIDDLSLCSRRMPLWHKNMQVFAVK